MKHNAKVWGHRGCRGVGNPPENSLTAFSAAIEQGANGIELDVFPAKDNELVVFHDETLDRMTNGCGEITSFTVGELKRLSLRNVNGDLSSETIPTLEEVMHCIDSYRRSTQLSTSDQERMSVFTLNIEIKWQGCAPNVENAIKRWLKRNWTYKNFQVSSFNIEALREMRKLNSHVPLGALFEGPLGHPAAPWDITEEELKKCLASIADLRPETVNITLPSLTERAVEMIRAFGASPIAWTSNETNPDSLPEETRSAIAAHLVRSSAVVITDYPAQTLAMLGSHQEAPTLAHASVVDC